jgi:hypothetical protein
MYSMYLLIEEQESYIHTCIYRTLGGKYRQNTVHSEMFSPILKNSFSLGGVNFFFLPSCIPLALKCFFGEGGLQRGGAVGYCDVIDYQTTRQQSLFWHSEKICVISGMIAKTKLL